MRGSSQRPEGTGDCNAARKSRHVLAIAHPEYFRRTLEKEGFQVVSEFTLGDHEAIPEKELEQFAQTSLKKGAQWLICTEKDRVKLNDELTLSLPIHLDSVRASSRSGRGGRGEFLTTGQRKNYIDVNT